MPLYEYQCQSCQHRFEVIQKYSDPPVDACRACGGPVTKLLSSPAIQFKGSGFYITDYARKDAGGSAKPASGSGSSESESKPAASSEGSAPSASSSPSSTSAAAPAAAPSKSSTSEK